MKTTILILFAIILFSCKKQKADIVTLHIEVTGNEITKTLKGNVYYGDQVIPVKATFEESYVIDVPVQDKHVNPSHDLWAAYINRNVDSGKENVSVNITVK